MCLEALGTVITAISSSSPLRSDLEQQHEHLVAKPPDELHCTMVPGTMLKNNCLD